MLQNILRFLGLGNNGAKISAGKKVLVIDDGQIERKIYSRALQNGGYSVVTASDGEQGLELVKIESPDLILLDYMMPGLNGKEVCERLKKDETTKNIPIVFLTGSIQPESVITCYDVGAEYYLSKPISSGMLLKQVRMVFQEQSAISGA